MAGGEGSDGRSPKGSTGSAPTSPSASASLAAAISRPQKALAAMQVPSFLRAYGYLPSGAHCWQRTPAECRTELDLRVLEHFEQQGHTWYAVRCLLRSEGFGCLQWQAPRRLCQLRQLLHEPLKEELAGDYQRYFADASFASRGGLPGTTSKLDNWCTLLAGCINSGAVPPRLVSLVLRFLAIPERGHIPDADGADEDSREVGEPGDVDGAWAFRPPALDSGARSPGAGRSEAWGAPTARPRVEVPEGTFGVPAVDISDDDLDASPLTPETLSAYAQSDDARSDRGLGDVA